MLRVFALLLPLLLALPAAAQLREGQYDLEGQNPDGSTYTGSVFLQGGPNGSWIATWRVGNAQINGLGIIQGGLLAIAYVVSGRPGIATFEVRADGKLQGNWTVGAGLGSEVLTPR